MSCQTGSKRSALAPGGEHEDEDPGNPQSWFGRGIRDFGQHVSSPEREHEYAPREIATVSVYTGMEGPINPKWPQR